MNSIPSDFYFALASVLSSIIVLALFWIADTVDREPWKTILSSYIAGIGTYLASAGFFFFLTQSLQPLRDSMATSWVVSFMVAIAFQIITCRLVLFQNKKHIDTITDYILHFCAVGIGFETAEKITTSLAILPWMQYISENLYDSVFLLGKSNPLMLMSLGIAAFFWRARKRVPNKRILAKISALSSITFLCSQAIFYSIPMIKNYTSPISKQLFQTLLF